MNHRRHSLCKLAALASTCASAAAWPLLARSQPLQNNQPAPTPAAPDRWSMPDEADPHLRTWMAFGASRAVWGDKLLAEVQRNLVAIAQAIARHEPVTLLVRPEEESLARRLLGGATGGPGAHPVTLLPAPLDDLWMRDTGPVFVRNAAGQKAAIDFNFNGWGDKQDWARDAKVAALVAGRAGVRRISARLVLEGGAIEVDGQGSALITESCVINPNRNPGRSKADVEAELKQLLGLQHIIWLPGIKGRDITDGHTDFYARFVAPGVVAAAYDPDPQSYDHAVTKRHLELLKTATDARGRKLRVVVLEAPGQVRPQFEGKHFAAGYLNFYVCNGAVIAPEFGDAAADRAAATALQSLFPGRRVVQVNIDGIAAGGGGIHCTTQQEPAVA